MTSCSLFVYRLEAKVKALETGHPEGSGEYEAALKLAVMTKRDFLLDQMRAVASERQHSIQGLSSASQYLIVFHLIFLFVP